jgi:hypothetical protein
VLKKYSKRFAVILFVGLLCPAAFAQMSQPGPALNMLQQMQGVWRSNCQPFISGARYQQTKLVVSFTHFAFTTDEFAEPDCRIKRASHKARYRFILRDPFVTLTNIEVFAIDFRPEEISSGISLLHPQNIVKYESGTLRLGSPPVAETEERLQLLDRELIFSR